MDAVDPAVNALVDAMVESADAISDELLRELDGNHDGKVVKEEFVAGFVMASMRIVSFNEVHDLLQGMIRGVVEEQIGDDICIVS
jgi:hypothetical protein